MWWKLQSVTVVYLSHYVLSQIHTVEKNPELLTKEWASYHQGASMPKVKLNIIVAVDQNNGIGSKGGLPWALEKEYEYFTRTTTRVKDKTKRNAMILGRITWESLPDPPMDNRLAVVITRNPESVPVKNPNEVVVVDSFDAALKHIESRNDIETIYVGGGGYIYKEALEHPNLDRVYMTEIQQSFECDTFFPAMDKSAFRLIEEENVPKVLQTEGGVNYYFRVYKKL